MTQNLHIATCLPAAWLWSRSDFDQMYLTQNFTELQVQNELPQRIYINMHMRQGLSQAIWLSTTWLRGQIRFWSIMFKYEFHPIADL